MVSAQVSLREAVSTQTGARWRRRPGRRRGRRGTRRGTSSEPPGGRGRRNRTRRRKSLPQTAAAVVVVATVRMKRTKIGKRNRPVSLGQVLKKGEEMIAERAMIENIRIGMMTEDLTEDSDETADMKMSRSKRKEKTLSEAASTGRPIKGIILRSRMSHHHHLRGSEMIATDHTEEMTEVGL